MFKLPIHYRFAKKLKLIGNTGTSTTASHIKSNKLTSTLLDFVKWLFDFKKRKRSRIKSDYINDEKIDYALQKVDDYIDSNSHITLPVTGSWVYSGFSFNTIGESITVLANGRLF